MKRRLTICFLVLLFGVIIGKSDSFAAAQIPSGYTYSISNDGCDFYIDAGGNTVCFDSAGNPIINEFRCDGTYTYFFQADGTAMRDRLSYHPDGIHVIYFDNMGHEVFSDFAHVKKSIAGDAVDDYCFFNVYGYMYIDVLTWDKTGKYLYYANPYGVMEVGKWFQFSDTVQWADGASAVEIAGCYGYATDNGTLMTNTWTYNWNNQSVYLQANGTVATGYLYDGCNYYILDDNEGYVISVIPGGGTNPEPEVPTGKYEYSLRTLNQYDIYAGGTVILALLTDNQDKSKIRLVYNGDDMSGIVSMLYRDVKYLDDSYRTNEWQEIKSRTGYIKSISFSEPGIKEIIIEEQVDGQWIEVERLNITVNDRRSAEDAWYNKVIESETNSSMTDYEKMCALSAYVSNNFVYDANDGTYLVFLTTSVGPWWEVKEIDCIDATAIVCGFATRLGLESEATYAGYLNHYYATVYIDGTGYMFDASPYADSNIVTEWEYVLE